MKLTHINAMTRYNKGLLLVHKEEQINDFQPREILIGTNLNKC